MEPEELNKLLEDLLTDPSAGQEFADVFSFDENWNAADRSIKVPRHTGVFVGKCPLCKGTIRTLHDKFCSCDSHYSMTCPHCRKKIGCHLEFEGYTCSLFLEKYDEDVHG